MSNTVKWLIFPLVSGLLERFWKDKESLETFRNYEEVTQTDSLGNFMASCDLL